MGQKKELRNKTVQRTKERNGEEKRKNKRSKVSVKTDRVHVTRKNVKKESVYMTKGRKKTNRWFKGTKEGITNRKENVQRMKERKMIKGRNSGKKWKEFKKQEKA